MKPLALLPLLCACLSSIITIVLLFSKETPKKTDKENSGNFEVYYRVLGNGDPIEGEPFFNVEESYKECESACQQNVDCAGFNTVENANGKFCFMRKNFTSAKKNSNTITYVKNGLASVFSQFTPQ